MPEPTPVTTIYSYNDVKHIIRSAANAIAMQLSLNSEWKESDDAVAQIVQAAGNLNPLGLAYNKLRYGEFRPVTSGAQEVSVNQRRHDQLRDECLATFWNRYLMLSERPNGAGEGFGYLEELVGRTRYAWAAISEQFEMARRVNSEVGLALNDALDRTYAIRTGASVAFMIVGSLPIVAAGAGAGAAAGAGTTLLTPAATTLSVLASTGTPWVIAAKVAGGGLVYGFLTELAFSKEDVKRSGAMTIHVEGGVVAGAVGGGGNVAQTALETARVHGETQLADAARLERNRLLIRKRFEQMRALAQGRSVSPRSLPLPEERRIAQNAAEYAERNLANASKWAARSGSVLFIGYGLYSMRDDIRTALAGVTADIDRTR